LASQQCARPEDKIFSVWIQERKIYDINQNVATPRSIFYLLQSKNMLALILRIQNKSLDSFIHLYRKKCSDNRLNNLLKKKDLKITTN
jgi:hypothetical protein